MSVESWVGVKARGVRFQLRPGAVVFFSATLSILALDVLPASLPGRSAPVYWGVALVGAVLFELGILCHEAAHAITARRHGMRVDRVVLTVFGGSTETIGHAPSPAAEARIALAGPAVSMVFAVLLVLLTVVCTAFGAPLAAVTGTYIAAGTLRIALINMLPGLPLDGGRVLHAWLWSRHRDRVRAARGAVRGGWAVGAAGVATGCGMAAAGVLTGVWVALSGGALLVSAYLEYRALPHHVSRARPGQGEGE